MMEIIKEMSFDSTYIGRAELENGVILYVSTNGYADGLDGKHYVGVFHENERGDWIPVGWTPDADKPVVIR